MHKRISCLLCIIIILFVTKSSFGVTFPSKPVPGHFYVDETKILPNDVAQKIDIVVKRLMRDKGIPIFVVAINSLADQKAENVTIEKYTKDLFNFWGVGSQQNNYGIVFLIAKEDHKTRIQLGASYSQRSNKESYEIMQSIIIPKFKNGDFSGGILLGVSALDNMARGIDNFNIFHKLSLSQGWNAYLIVVVTFFILLIFSFIKSGKKGWAGLISATLLGFLAYLFSLLPQNDDDNNNNDNFRGGGDNGSSSNGSSNNGSGFDGGSSDGGGTTGSW